VRYLLDGLLPLGVPAILAATSNAGKSLIGMMISFAVAAGWNLFGRKGPEEPLKVLFVEMEDDEAEIKRRHRRCRDLFREDPNWGPQQEALLKANWRGLAPEYTSAIPKTIISLLPFLQAHGEVLCRDGGQVGLIVLDTFASLSEGEENRAEVQREFWAACYSLAASTGGTPLVIHHVRKPGAGPKGKNGPSMVERLNFDALRGSSAIVASAQAIIQAEPMTSEEAARLGLDEERAAAGNFVILALTKIKSGSKGAWIALEQRETWENGAGFFVPMANGDRVCAALKGKGASANLNLREAIFLSIVDGCEDRQELAKRHWPGIPPDKAERALKSQLSHMKSRGGWFQKGQGFKLTGDGFAKAQELRRSGGDFEGDLSIGEDRKTSNHAGFEHVSSGDFAGDFAPTGTETGSPAESQRRLAPLVPGKKSPKSPSPRRGAGGDFGTEGVLI
jgi:hypothetical protein